MHDPGRIAVLGSCFTTMEKKFRDRVFPEILGLVSKRNEAIFFVIDIKGCHSSLCVLGPDKTPFSYRVFRAGSDQPDLWKAIVEASSGQFTMADKPKLSLLCSLERSCRYSCFIEALKLLMIRNTTKPSYLLRNF